MQGAFLGYWIGAPHANNGYMTEGLALVQRLHFQKEGFSPRYLKIHGEWRDHERWALLQEDWQAHRTPTP